MPHVRKHSKSCSGASVDDRKKTGDGGNILPKDDQIVSSKTSAKTTERRSGAKENVPTIDMCLRNGIIHFPIIPGLTLHKKSKNNKAASKSLKSIETEVKKVDATEGLNVDKKVKFTNNSEKVSNFGLYERKPCFPAAITSPVPDVSLAELIPEDPIAACLPCLEANGTYICTPCNPRCYIIQKVINR